MTPTPEQVEQWTLEERLDPGVYYTFRAEEIMCLVTRAMAEQAVTTLSDVAETLRRAGAALPAPEVTGKVEGAVVTGLCVALASVESKLAAIRANAPKVMT